MMRPRRGPSQATWVDDVHTPRPPLAAVHLAVLWGFAVAQPYFDVVGCTSALFAARAAGPRAVRRGPGRGAAAGHGRHRGARGPRGRPAAELGALRLRRRAGR